MPIPLTFKAKWDDSALMAGLRRARTSVSNLQKKMESDWRRSGLASGSKGGGAVGLLATGAKGGLIGGAILGGMAARNVAKTGDELVNLSHKTGMTTTSLAALMEMGKGANVELSEIAEAVVKMQIALRGAAKEGSAAAEALRSIGLTMEELDKLQPEQRFATIATAIAKMASAGQKMTAAKAFFGKGGPDFFEMFDDISRMDMSKVSEFAQKMGDAAGPLGEMSDRWEKIKMSAAGNLARFMAGVGTGEIGGGIEKIGEKAKAVEKVMAAALTGQGPLANSVGLNALSMYPQSDPFNRARHVPSSISLGSVSRPDALSVGRKESGLSRTRSGLGGASGLGIYGTGSTGSGGQAYGYIKRGDAKMSKQAEANIKALKLQETLQEDIKVIRETVEGWDQ